VGEHAGWLAEAATDIEVMIDGRDRGMRGQGMGSDYVASMKLVESGEALKVVRHIAAGRLTKGGCTCIVEHAGGVMPGVFRRYCIHRYIPFQEAAQ